MLSNVSNLWINIQYLLFKHNFKIFFFRVAAYIEQLGEKLMLARLFLIDPIIRYFQ